MISIFIIRFPNTTQKEVKLCSVLLSSAINYIIDQYPPECRYGARIYAVHNNEEALEFAFPAKKFFEDTGINFMHYCERISNSEIL